eukprot:4601818-Amphidinium_carterae.2
MRTRRQQRAKLQVHDCDAVRFGCSSRGQRSAIMLLLPPFRLWPGCALLGGLLAEALATACLGQPRQLGKSKLSLLSLRDVDNEAEEQLQCYTTHKTCPANIHPRKKNGQRPCCSSIELTNSCGKKCNGPIHSSNTAPSNL